MMTINHIAERALRKLKVEVSESNYSQAAKVIGTSSSNVRRWMKGKSCPNPEKCFLILTALGDDDPDSTKTHLAGKKPIPLKDKSSIYTTMRLEHELEDLRQVVWDAQVRIAEIDATLANIRVNQLVAGKKVRK